MSCSPSISWDSPFSKPSTAEGREPSLPGGPPSGARHSQSTGHAVRKQTSRNASLQGDRGTGDPEGTELSSTRASSASRHFRTPSWPHWGCRRAGSSLRAGMEALEVAPCGSSRLSLAPGAVCASRGAMEDRGPGQPGPLAAPRISTGNIHTPHGQPSARARGQRWPPFSLGTKGGAGAGKHIQDPIPPSRGTGPTQQWKCSRGTGRDLQARAGAARTQPDRGI